MIEQANEFGSLSEIELRDFKEVNGIVLPEDYRAFLLAFNGGRPNPSSNAHPATIVTYILGMHNGPYYASLYNYIDTFSKRLPFGSFPIATDPFGNLFLMSVDPEGMGHIYFWDHEGEPVHQDGHYTANCVFVAGSFSEFVSNLH